ncbi:VWA domain-containing protein [Kutzneria buriramensis]|uniref:Ca-activated chloride channel family protein n=1 Tax=Kutzneria buriramensis TaxID=1045776 RepID=A0A3E0I7X5_9PSEU|nr:VWA domain-containing protein [Kutzneria buriramensis]REH54245.1 Ca-activated chloride channel family protein [Kutzneria buriramensis]
MSLTGFTDPLWLLLIAVVAVLAIGYLVVQRVRVRDTKRFTNLELLERVAPRRPGWQRHIPPAMLAVGLILLSIALAGPTAEQKVPRNRATVMLVMDVSLSMNSTDIPPSRLAAAQSAAKSFADQLTPGVNLGLIEFAGSATVLVSPTTDRNQVKAGIDALKPAEATATGDAIAAAVQAIQSFGKLLTGADGPPPARIVLLSDGRENNPADPNAPRGAYTQAKAAHQAQMPISGIYFGTKGGTADIDGQQEDVPGDEQQMQQIARLSGGDSYDAHSAGQLQNVYNSLASQIGYETKQVDASQPWLALGTLISLLSVAASVLITQRIS